MIISENTKESLNRILQKLFNGNAQIDNLYYNLQYNNYINLANAIHEPVAHQLPAWADAVSDFMDKVGARPVRYGAPDYNKDYTVKEVFHELYMYFEELRRVLNEAIDDADMQGDAEARIFLEDFLNKNILPFVRQGSEWMNILERVGEDDFNLHISAYTHFIK